MISTAGLELTNFINADLTWKKASKGNRSATRRTRKLVTNNLMVGMELADNNPQRVEQTKVSESEKIGQGFSGKIEHVPIKKRKFNFRSPSPPPRTHASAPGTCPNSNGNRLHLVVDASSVAISSPDVVDVKISDSVNEEHGYREDFSGIEMLAAAACSDSFDADVDHPEEKPEVEEPLQQEENDSAMPVEETVSSPKAANCSPRQMVVEDRLEDSSFQDSRSAFALNSSCQKDDDTAEMSAPSRLHWDLNVMMDAWEQPCDTLSAGSQAKDVEGIPVVGSGKLGVLEGLESDEGAKDAKHNNMVDGVVSSEEQEKTHASSDLKGLSYGSDGEDNPLEASSHLDCNFDECGADPKASTQVVSLHPNIDGVACANDRARNTPPPNHLQEQTKYHASGVLEDEIMCAENVHVEKFDVSSTCVPTLDRVTCEVDRTTLNRDGEDCARPSSLHSDVNAQEMSVENCDLPEPVFHRVEPASKAEEVGVNNPSSKCENAATSSESMKEVQPMVTEGAKGEIDSLLDVQSDKLMHASSGIVTDIIDTGCELSTLDECGANATTNSSCKTDYEEACDDIYESDTSQDDKVHTVCLENSGVLQDGYDSQFEDGELRDSNVHCWEEENDCDGAEIEQVDYESECDGERFSILDAEDTDNKTKFESGSSPGSGEVTEKSECAVGDALGDTLTSSDVRILEAADGSKIKKLTSDFENESNDKDFASRVVGSRASLSTDVLPRSRSSNFDDLCPRSEGEADPNRFMERDRFSVRMRRGSPRVGHIVDARRSPPCSGPYGSGRPRPRSIVDNHIRRKYISSTSNNVYRSGGHIFNTHHSPPWHGPYGSGRPRPRSIIESRKFVMTSERTNLEATGVEGFDSRVRRHMNSSSDSVYRPLNRRSLSYRDDIYAGTAPARDDISPDRSRFRRYPLRDDSRGTREDYCRPMPKYSTDDHMAHRLGRRERSISPLGGERLHCVQHYKKTRSRSRSRSPKGWFWLRERNDGSRRRSRSPTFRSARTNKVKMPYKKRSEVEYEEGFISPQRNQFSPQFGSRFDDRISGLDNWRDRKSSPPVRMFRQSQRFDPVRSIRPMIHARRFTEMGGSGRGCKYECAEDDDRRKQGNRYDIIDRARRYNDNHGGV